MVLFPLKILAGHGGDCICAAIRAPHRSSGFRE